jgi:replicative DNA helicase
MVAATPNVIERLPPHNVEAEQSVLGSLLIDRDAIIKVAAFLRPEAFYSVANELIYRAILDLYNRREPTDFVTLSDELQRRGQYDQAGGLSYLSSLLTAVPTAVHVEYYARIVERAAILRRLIDAGTRIVDIGFREGIDTEEALDAAERAVFDVSQSRQSRDFVSMGEVLDRFFDQIDYLQQHRGEVVGVATGYSDLDQLTGGMQRSDLIIVAARPSMGKTSLALGMAYGAAVVHGRTVGIFSLEMSAEQLVQRILSMETGVDTHRLRLGQIDDGEWDRISRAFGRLSEAPIYIDDTASASIMDVRSKARRLQSEQGLDMIVIDYLQLMSARRSENRVQEISEISRGLKGLARELNVPVVALSQLSRAVESRADHKPMLSDLRESGCLTGDTPVYLPESGTYRSIASLCGQTGFTVLAIDTATWKLTPKRVTAAFCTGRKPVFRLTTRLGRTIRATANHKFLTIHGWRRLDGVPQGMRIALPRLDARSRGVLRFRERSVVLGARATQASPLPILVADLLPGRRGDACVARGAAAAASRFRETGHPVASFAEGGLNSQTESAVIWDEVVSIEPAGEEEVYDLTVEDLHSFVAADIIVHNSIEQDADVVVFIYREDKYEEDSEKKGIAEIIVAKHRNGPVGSINLRFFDRTARFADLEVYPGPGL